MSDPTSLSAPIDALSAHSDEGTANNSLRPLHPLASFSTCEIADVLGALGDKTCGSITGVLPMSSIARQGRICGPAFPVRMVEDDVLEPVPAPRYFDVVQAGCIVVIEAPNGVGSGASILHGTIRDDHNDDPWSAMWDKFMTAAAQRRGVQGVVTSGRCRHISDLDTANFPVFACGQATASGCRYARPDELGKCSFKVTSRPQVPSLDQRYETIVSRGDWIVADGDGVVRVPKAMVDEVLELVQVAKLADEQCLLDLQAGKDIRTSLDQQRRAPYQYVVTMKQRKTEEKAVATEQRKAEKRAEEERRKAAKQSNSSRSGLLRGLLPRNSRTS